MGTLHITGDSLRLRLMWEQSRNPPTLKGVPGATDLGRNDVKNLQVGSDCTGVVIHWLEVILIGLPAAGAESFALALCRAHPGVTVPCARPCNRRCTTYTLGPMTTPTSEAMMTAPRQHAMCLCQV